MRIIVILGIVVCIKAHTARGVHACQSSALVCRRSGCANVISASRVTGYCPNRCVLSQSYGACRARRSVAAGCVLHTTGLQACELYRLCFTTCRTGFALLIAPVGSPVHVVLVVHASLVIPRPLLRAPACPCQIACVEKCSAAVLWTNIVRGGRPATEATTAHQTPLVANKIPRAVPQVHLMVHLGCGSSAGRSMEQEFQVFRAHPRQTRSSPFRFAQRARYCSAASWTGWSGS